MSTPSRRGLKWGIVLFCRRPKRLNHAKGSLYGVREPEYGGAQPGYRLSRVWELAKHD